MEISTIAATTARVNNPESEPEEPTLIQPSKPLSLTNGLLKRHPPVVVSYKECLKNHAATIGGHAVDGCGEFMPSPTATSTNPTSLKCAACGCHRNFHRRHPEEAPQPVPSHQHVIEYKPHHRHHPPPPPAGHSSPNSASPPPISSSYYPSAPHMLLALSAGVSAPPTGSNPAGILDPKRRKRFRSKFTQDQKKKMYGFADRIGWKMQRKDEQLIVDFCGEIGVEKGVFKVWMHNHKHGFVRRDLGQKNNTINGIGDRNSIDNIDDTRTHDNNENNYDGAGDANASSSS